MPLCCLPARKPLLLVLIALTSLTLFFASVLISRYHRTLDFRLGNDLPETLASTDEDPFPTPSWRTPTSVSTRIVHSEAPATKVETLPLTTTSSTVTSILPTVTEAEKSWKFDPIRDSRNYGLSASQCSSAFGGLFKEINRAVEYKRESGRNITAADIDLEWKDEGVMRAMIYDRQLYILESKIYANAHDRMRSLAILHSINRALTSTPPSEAIPNIEFSFSVSDNTDETHAHHTIWSLTRKREDREMWLMSDFGYWSWPLDGMVGEYHQVVAEIHDNEGDWDGKIPKLVWRGAPSTNVIRKDLLKEAKGKDWADVKEVVFGTATQVQKSSENAALSMAQQCRYRFVLQTEGYSYSGRGKYLQNCHSVYIAHKRAWIEPHHALLIPSGPSQNFVEVERDFSDLDQKMQELLANETQARCIADNGVTVFRDRHLTPAAQACYWRELIRGWASVSFEPEGWESVQVGDGAVLRRLRGIPFESFVINIGEYTKCRWQDKIRLRCW